MSPAPSVAIIGMGVLGGRLARELVSGPVHPSVALHSSREQRREQLSSTMADAINSGAVRVHERDDEPAGSVSVVVLTGDQRSQVDDAERHLEAGRHVVTTVDAHDHAAALLGLDQRARTLGRTVVVGSCFSPGLSDVVARWAARQLDEVDEIHFARHGASGPRCAADRLDAMRRSAHEWRDRAWVTNRPGSGRQLCWFPDPVGGRDAYLADTAEPAIAVHSAVGLLRSSARIVLNRRDRLAQYLPRVIPAPSEGTVGALRVELRGRSGAGRSTIVLGAFDRPAVAAGALGAEVVLSLLAGDAPVGAIGAGAVADPGDLLMRCRSRGVRVARLGDRTAEDLASL